MKPNPPIPGHRLLHEGYVWPWINPVTEMYDGHRGGCECGARPSQFPNVSVGAMKRWHRAHKADLRGEVMLP